MSAYFVWWEGCCRRWGRRKQKAEGGQLLPQEPHVRGSALAAGGPCWWWSSSCWCKVQVLVDWFSVFFDGLFSLMSGWADWLHCVNWQKSCVVCMKMQKCIWTMGKVYRCSDAKKMITKWSEDLHNWKCCPRIVGRGNKTIVDGAGHLAVRCHHKSTF